MKRTLALAITGSALLCTLLTAGVAFAQTTTTPPPSSEGHGFGRGGMMGMRPGVFGTVSAINGDSLTVASKGFGPNASAQTYTVDATNATVTKAGAASSVSNIAVGDTIMVQGTVSGTNVTATAIRDLPAGQAGGIPTGMGGKGPWGGHASSTAPRGGPGAPVLPQGNGEPVIGGAVTAISGSALTITNKSNVTYTVDATNATVIKSNATSTLSSVAVGDNVVVQGTVNGNAVTASSVLDSGAPKTSSTTGGNPMSEGFRGILGGIGGLFHHLFGFF